MLPPFDHPFIPFPVLYFKPCSSLVVDTITMKSFQIVIAALCASVSVALASPESVVEFPRRALYEKRASCSKTYKGTYVDLLDQLFFFGVDD